MKYFIKKFITLIITLFLISIVTFAAFQVIPGDSAMVSLGTNGTKEQLEELRKQYGYDDNVVKRYTLWLSKAVRGDFGESYYYEKPVNELIGSRLGVTLGLVLFSFFMILIVSIPLGIFSARKESGFWFWLITIMNQVGMAIPPFFLGMLFLLIFGILLKWFIPGAYVPMNESVTKYISYMFFPAITIAIPKIAMVVKFLRSSILRQLTLDYVRTARSKGNTENAVIYKHVLKNALIPVVTVLGVIIADVLTGSIIIEQVFNLPGIGRLLVVSIANRDFNLVQAIVLYIAAFVIIINFLVDLLYQYIDPRIDTN